MRAKTPHTVLGLKLTPTVLVCAWLSLAGCGDPVHDQAVQALGAEAPGVPTGPLHRPGQPCVLCHSGSGNAPEFSMAGTVYVLADSRMPIENVSINLIDSLGHRFTATTNCAGNFYVRPQDFNPNAPTFVSMQRDDVTREMDTPIYREGSCAGCHDDPRGPASVGHVYLIDDPTVETVPVSQCH